MTSKGEVTKEKLMDAAEKHFLVNGFVGTSIDDLITEVGITKGGFFYHFEGKNALAYSLMQRYRERDELLFSGLFKRAEDLTEDPLQQMLIFAKLLAEMMDKLEGMHPGCLVSSFTYDSPEVNDQVRAITADMVMDWRRLFKQQIEKINLSYTPKIETSSDDLADMLSTLIEGGIIVSRAVKDPKILSQQILEYRNYVRLLYSD
ncbi:MAG: TetR family transcriptional regulator [Gammaproteobacteria bacterium]|nr:TetR family transcriptional regulator [Gammaproteobacteria bacterium]